MAEDQKHNRTDGKDDRARGIPDLLYALDYDYAQWKRTRKLEDPLAPVLVAAVQKLRPDMAPTLPSS